MIGTIVEYNPFIDLEENDYIVFLDGTTKRIKKADDHHVVLDDGSLIDLFTVSIKGIIKHRIIETKDYSPRFSTPHKQEHYDYDSIYELNSHAQASNKKAPATHQLTYFELFKMMESADKSDLHFSNYFWHYTTALNLASIIKDGFFKSRYNTSGNIPFDNRKNNETTYSVIGKNKSRLTTHHVRMYLNPKNATIFNFIKNTPKNILISYCAIAIKKDALFASANPTFLYYQNGKFAGDDVFREEHKLNKHYGSPFNLYNYSLFDFKETYSEYDQNQSEYRKRLQMAEFLVLNNLSISFIDKIIFYTEEGKNIFLSKIYGVKGYNDIRNKCCVDWHYFFYPFEYD